jgi:hypothetical protein
VVGGKEVITIEHVDRMADDLAPDWPKSRSGGTDGTWRVMIDGEPSFDGEFEVGCIRTGAAFPLSEAANALDVTHRMHRMGPHRMRHRNSFAIASTAAGPG